MPSIKITLLALSRAACAWYKPLSMPYIGDVNATTLASDAASKVYIDGLQARYSANTLQQYNSVCNSSNVSIRQAWEDMDKNGQQAYINAVKCMGQQPAQSDLSIVPGARNRIDDYVWQHTAQTNYIHFSGLLLPWHRQFIAQWEKELRQTCGYTGSLPYWDWSKHAYNQSEAPVFKSFGGNGAYVPHGRTTSHIVNLGIAVDRDAGTGGGCVQDGPFAGNWSLNVGLVTPQNDTTYGSYNTLSPNNTFGQQYQPRCLKRDFLQSTSSAALNYTNVALLMQQEDIHTFHPLLENGGIHNGGHFFTGGDMADVYASPNDPLFFLHHAQVDRLWTIWQGQDQSRQYALDGTMTFLNIPPSANATLDDVMEFGVVGGKLPIRQAMNTISQELCYVYV